MALKWIKVTITLLGESHNETVEAYTQQMRYDYYRQVKPNMVAEIVAVVNGPTVPQYQTAPMSSEEIEANLRLLMKDIEAKLRRRTHD